MKAAEGEEREEEVAVQGERGAEQGPPGGQSFLVVNKLIRVIRKVRVRVVKANIYLEALSPVDANVPIYWNSEFSEKVFFDKNEKNERKTYGKSLTGEQGAVQGRFEMEEEEEDVTFVAY